MSDSTWKKEHTITFTTRLNKHTDADLIEYLSHVDSRMGEIKRLLRVAIQYEKDAGREDNNRI